MGQGVRLPLAIPPFYVWRNLWPAAPMAPSSNFCLIDQIAKILEWNQPSFLITVAIDPDLERHHFEPGSGFWRAASPQPGNEPPDDGIDWTSL